MTTETDDTTFEQALTGRTLTSVEKTDFDDEIVFVDEDGRRYRLFHKQDCCESVTIEDIQGDLSDLVGSPILSAYESVSAERPADASLEYTPESETWTFYRITTVKGTVVIRWCGTSNGYYSESVNFEVMPSAA